MKRIRNVLLLSLILVLMLLPQTLAKDGFVAEYVLDWDNVKYDATQQTYEIDVYLNTVDYLSVGTFGARYHGIDAAFKLCETNFYLFKDFSTAEYTAVQWYINEEIDPPKGNLQLGTITVSNVAEDALADIKISIGLLNWYDTPQATVKATGKPDFSETFPTPTPEPGATVAPTISPEPTATPYAPSNMNEEIFRKVEGEDVPGYYQGYDMEDELNPKWVDIYFNPQTGVSVTGTVNSYNKKNTTDVYLYKTGIATPYRQVSATDVQFGKKGEVASEYTINSVPVGTYTLVISKSAHLTYQTEITVTENGLTVDNVSLICGDITADERINFNDRAELMRFFNRQKPWNGGDEFLKADLNGDDLVNEFDRELLKSNYMKTY